MTPGEICRHDRFYVDADTGELKRKYFVVLAIDGRDLVTGLLTSKARPESPACYHGDPYPGFFMGVLGQGLNLKSWLDLRALVDLDIKEARRAIEDGYVGMIGTVPASLFVDAMACAAAAADTTRRQETAIRNQLARSR